MQVELRMIYHIIKLIWKWKILFFLCTSESGLCDRSTIEMDNRSWTGSAGHGKGIWGRRHMQIAVSRRDNFICSTELWWATETQPLARKGAVEWAGEWPAVGIGVGTGMGVWMGVDARRLPN